MPRDLCYSHLYSALIASVLIEAKRFIVRSLKFLIRGIKPILIFQFSIFQFVLIEIYLIYCALNSFLNAPLAFRYINFQKITFNLLKFLLKNQFHFKENQFILNNSSSQPKIIFLSFNT